MPVAITRYEHSSKELRFLSKKARKVVAARRILAIADILDGKPRHEAARRSGMDRQTLRDWVHRYNESGIEGLYDRPRGRRKPLLNEAQKAELKALVIKGPTFDLHGVVRWRRCDLQKVIKEHFGVHCHERTVGKFLHAMGFAKLTGRPSHPKVDRDKQETFKKTSPTS